MERITEERRRFIRLEVPLELRYIVEDDPSQSQKRTAIKNLSCEGLRFISENAIREGSLVDLDLLIPRASNPVHIKGKVVWAKNMPGENSAIFEIGIEFVRIEEDNKNTFLKYLCDLIYNETKMMKRA